VGNFYTNITFQLPNQEQLIDYLTEVGRSTYVSPTINGFTVVYDEKSETQCQELFNLTSQLSRRFNCAALAVLVHDDQVLHYELYQAGELIDEYISDPGFHNPEAGSFPEGGDAKKLCTSFGVKHAINQVRTILRKPGGEGSYLFASARHERLVRTLGISPFWARGVGGYRNIERGSIAEIDEDDPSPEVALSMLRKTQ
jgi:hypothetical protein